MKMTDLELMVRVRIAANMWFRKEDLLLLEEVFRRWQMNQIKPEHAIETNIPDEEST